jgi:hypothetical protein
MRPDPLNAFHQAIRLGPDYCPPELFDGSVQAIVRGLKVHANNVAHARHVALEETYPRLLAAVGAEQFHHAVDCFLDRTEILHRPLDAIGEGFADEFDAAADRDLARSEWAWLEAFHAAEADALTLPQLAAMTPDALASARIAAHSAVRLLTLEARNVFAWNPAIDGEGQHLLVTRPDAEVRFRFVDDEEAAIINRLQTEGPSSEVLGASPAALVGLIESGALCLENDDDDD